MIVRHEEFEIEVDVRRRHVLAELREATGEEVQATLDELPAAWARIFKAQRPAVFVKYICSQCGVGISGVYPRGSVLATTCACYAMFQSFAGGKAS